MYLRTFLTTVRCALVLPEKNPSVFHCALEALLHHGLLRLVVCVALCFLSFWVAHSLRILCFPIFLVAHLLRTPFFSYLFGWPGLAGGLFAWLTCLAHWLSV